MPPLAYIAGQFPLRSETFVWREVRELRRLGWTVHTFALYAPDEQTPAELLDLRESTTIVYGGSRGERWRGMASQPRSLLRGAADAISDREPSSMAARAKLVVQAGVGASLGSELRRRGVRHVHAHFAHAPTSVAMYAARAANIPFSFTGHANDLFQRRQLLKRKLQRAGFVACISEWHRALYRSIVPRDDEAYPIIRCGVDVDRLLPRTVRPANGRLHVVSVCRLVEKKGIDVLVRAVASLRDRGLDVGLSIGGDGPLRASLGALCDELNVADCVHFRGAVDADQVRSLLGEADLFALPCRVDANGDRDGIPVAMMEAMACGLPVVGGDLPAIRELVADGDTGLLVDGNNVEAVAGAIAFLSLNPAAREGMGIAGRARVTTNFSLSTGVRSLGQKFDASCVRFA